jgi:superfamily II DNA/RNA helicase
MAGKTGTSETGTSETGTSETGTTETGTTEMGTTQTGTTGAEPLSAGGELPAQSAPGRAAASRGAAASRAATRKPAHAGAIPSQAATDAGVRSGDQQSADQQSADRQSGDQQSGDQQSSDLQPTDRHAGGHPSVQRDQQPENQQPENRQPEDRQPEDRQPEDRQPENRQPEDRQPENRQPEDRQPEDRQPEDRQPENDRDEANDEPALIPIAAGPPPEPARTVFSDLGLSAEVLRAIDDMGYRHPTPIQEQAIPYVLMGRDVMGTAQTGTGKTAGFTLPMLDILSGSRARARMPRSLILEPTRELALQVAENFVQYGKYLKLTHALIIGGESMSDQKDVLNRGVDVLIATPGRLLDMFDRGTILLSDTKLLVIDEADRMLDMGFIPDVERIVSMLPKTRQTLFFSATMGPEIRRLVDAFLTNPKEIAVSRAASVATTITEGLALVAEHDKREALRRLIRSQNVQNALIFCNRKKDVDILHKSLSKHHFDAGALHGDMAQTVRFATLEKFKANELRLLVCSDVAARGLDIGGLSHVFNFDVPIHAEDYVHRIGRTGRAGLEGKAFTIASPEDRYAVEQIEKLIGHPIPPILVEGLDPVDWAERDGRKRRGRKTAAAAPKKAADRKPRAAKDPADKPPVAERMRPERTRPERSRPERSRAERAAQPELPVMAQERPAYREEPRHEPISHPDAGRPDTGRPDTGRPDTGRPDTGRPDTGRPDTRRAEPRHSEPRHPESRRGESRHPESRRSEAGRSESNRAESNRSEPRRSEPEFRRERYRRDDDLGPAVVGFGDDVPAFMFLRARSPVTGNRETDA